MHPVAKSWFYLIKIFYVPTWFFMWLASETFPPVDMKGPEEGMRATASILSALLAIVCAVFMTIMYVLLMVFFFKEIL